jgi:hypothetical protein
MSTDRVKIEDSLETSQSNITLFKNRMNFGRDASIIRHADLYTVLQYSMMFTIIKNTRTVLE